MQSIHKSYDYKSSISRIVGILDQSDINYKEKDSLPNRDQLTFSNGFYAYCSALSIDIRDSSSLPSKYKRPKLARLYRAYISESIAVMASDPDCREINVAGDGVWCVVNTPWKSDIDYVFSTATQLNSLIKILNCKSKSRGFDSIAVGIGISYGRALMIKAGYSGSGMNDVVYMGDVVNEAAKLGAKGSSGSYWTKSIMMSSVFHQNLNDHNRSLTQYVESNCYGSNAINVPMQDWYDENCT